jgi:hypothetical protein
MRAIITTEVHEGFDPKGLSMYLEACINRLPSYPWPAAVTVMSGPDFTAALEELAEGKLREGNCFRCGVAVTEQYEVAAVDPAGRSDCLESDEPGMPHEIDAPEGWDD